VEYEEKLRDVPRVEQLESHLANKILEQEAIKKQLEKLRSDKEKETQTTQQKYEQDMKAMRAIFISVRMVSNCISLISPISPATPSLHYRSYAIKK